MSALLRLTGLPGAEDEHGFLRAALAELVGVLDADAVIVGERAGSGGTAVRTLAMCAGGSLVERGAIPLAGSANERVLGGRVYSVPVGATDRFPEDALLAELGAQAYCGAPLVDTQGRTMGLVAALFRPPMGDLRTVERVLAVFSDRIARELATRRAQAGLRATGARHRALLEAIPDLVLRVDARGVILDFRSGRGFPFAHPDWVVGRSFADAPMDDAIKTALGDCLLRAMSTGETQVHECEIPVAGEPHTFEARFTRCEAGEGLIVVRDVTESTRTAFELVTHNRFLTSVLAALTHPFYVIDAHDHTIVLANPASGLTQGEPGKTCHAASHRSLHPCAEAGMSCPLAEVSRTRQPVSVVHSHFGNDGERRTFEVHGYPILDERGDVAQMIEYSLDITERRTAEEAREKLMRVLETAADVEALLLGAGDPFEVVDEVVAMLGCAAMVSRCTFVEVVRGDDGTYRGGRQAEWCGPGVQPLVIGSAPHGPEDAAYRSLAARVRRGEVLAHRADSLPRPERRVLCAEASQVIALQPVFHEGAWRGSFGFEDFKAGREWSQPELMLLKIVVRAFELAMERHERETQRAELAAVVEQATEAVMISDLAGRIRYVNEAFSRMTGVARDLAVGRPALKPVPGRPLVPKYEEIVAAVGRGDMWRGVTSVARADGGVLHLQSTAFPLHDARGASAGIGSIHVDITSLLALEEQLRRAQKMEALGQFASGIAHDFNNMIMVILGTAELLQRWASPDDPGRTELNVISRTAQRAAELSRGLLAFSRRQLLQMEYHDLGEVVASITPMIRRLVPENIEIEASRAAAPCPVRVDRGQMEQVLLNLAVNARDAMPGGGALTFRSENALIDEEYVATHPWATLGPYVALSVRDTGSGMDQATAARVFEPFFTTKAPGKGTGLGLATVYGIVKQHGGMIDVRTSLGQGTEFRMYLPRVEGPAVATTIKDLPHCESRHERILLVEDHADLRRILARYLDELGYDVVEAADGLDALRRLEAGQAYDLVISDVVMPKLGGVTLFARVREMLPRLPFLLTSGYAGDDPSLVELPAGDRVAFIPKPYAVEALAVKLRELLDRQGD